MSKKLIVFTDSGDTLVNEGTEYRNEGSPIVQSCELIDGAKEMLLTLKERGYTIELVADGYTQSFDNSYGQHGLKNIFDARTISEEVGEEKPSQAMFETAMKLLHLTDEDKKRIIMVGNNLERDIVGANRFGITSVFIKWSPRYPMEPKNEEEVPDYIIHKPLELLDLVEKLVSEDPAIKGVWCVPKYSNPQGITYSDETVYRFANLKPAAEDFRIFWDNAYCVHHLYEDKQDYLLEILMECKKAGNQDMVYKFSSTSKISFPGSGIAAIAASDANLADIRNMMKVQTIGHDKVNQLRHVRFFKDIHGIVEHMKKHADIMRPKFETVINTLERELGGLEIGSWIAPRGGYFISFDAMEGCAKAIVAKAKEAGLVMTGAGATFPYGKDPKDSNIRIAPSYPTPEELAVAAEIFVLSVKLVSIDKLLKNL